MWEITASPSSILVPQYLTDLLVGKLRCRCCFLLWVAGPVWGRAETWTQVFRCQPALFLLRTHTPESTSDASRVDPITPAQHQCIGCTDRHAASTLRLLTCFLVPIGKWGAWQGN